MKTLIILAAILVIPTVGLSQTTWYVPDDFPAGIQAAISDASVLDGDTIIVNAKHLGLVRVRLFRYNTPEYNTRRGWLASQLVAKWLPIGEPIILVSPPGGWRYDYQSDDNSWTDGAITYHLGYTTKKRLVADVLRADGVQLGPELAKLGLARR